MTDDEARVDPSPPGSVSDGPHSTPDSSFARDLPPSDSSEPAARAPGMPRPPGVFPPGFTAEYTLTSQPIPGQPLNGGSSEPVGIWVRFTATGNSTQQEIVAGQRKSDRHSSEDRKRASRARKNCRSAISIVALAPAFPAPDSPPPKFAPRPIQYPSGNALGTQLHPQFGERLKHMLMGSIPGPAK